MVSTVKIAVFGAAITLGPLSIAWAFSTGDWRYLSGGVIGWIVAKMALRD